MPAPIDIPPVRGSTETRSTVRVSTLDRMHVGNRIIAIVGPLCLPDVTTASDRISAFAELGPAARLGLRPDMSRGRWSFDPAASTQVHQVAAPADPAELLLVPDGGAPFEATLAGDYLRTVHDHGIGEVQLALISHLVLLGVVDPNDADFRSRLSARPPSLPGTALRVFGRHPALVREILGQRRATADVAVAEGASAEGASAEGAGAEGSVAEGPYPARVSGARATAQSVAITADTIGRLRARREADGSAASVMTMLMCAVAAALAAAGVELDGGITVPVDLRRYRRGSNPLGNFVSGVWLPHLPGDDPGLLNRRLAAAIAAGRPLLGALRSTAAVRAGRFVHAEPTGRVRAHLVFSGVRELPEFSRYPWREPGVGGYRVGVQSAGQADIIITAIQTHGTFWLSASYYPAVHDDDVIFAALSAVGDDPIRFLPLGSPKLS